MAINEQHRQRQLAQQLEHLARTLAHSSKSVLDPNEFHEILGEIHSTATSLAQACRQLGRWTILTTEHIHHNGYDPGQGDALHNTTLALQKAATAYTAAATHVMEAQEENSRIRWRGPDRSAKGKESDCVSTPTQKW